jgi:hypothetical protein
MAREILPVLWVAYKKTQGAALLTLGHDIHYALHFAPCPCAFSCSNAVVKQC